MSRKENLEALLQSLQADLTLTTEQSTGIRGLVQTHMEQRKALRAQFGEDKVARKEAVKPLNQQLRKDIGSLLDARQKDVFQQNKEAYKEMLRD
ncbi:MAG: hypothetical protein GC205_02465 [Bacteroidetes bacterium]|nr:hypothetical protein [Bacteroidota bacterium]